MASYLVVVPIRGVVEIRVQADDLARAKAEGQRRAKEVVEGDLMGAGVDESVDYLSLTAEVQVAVVHEAAEAS